jgi:hypothetical protein
MSKKDILKTLDISTFVSATIATVLVSIFQFTGSVAVMKYAIIMYTVCFLILTIVLSIKVYMTFSKKQLTEVEEESVELEKTDENDTKKKTLSIVYLVLSALAFIFTFVMLILY